MTIANHGDEILELSGNPRIVVEGESFSLLQDAARTIVSGETYTFKVSFRPETEGGHTGSIIIESNDPDTPLFILGITGQGNPVPQPEITVWYGSTFIENGTTTEVDAGPVNADGKRIFNFHVRNIGDATLVCQNEPVVIIEGSGFSLVQDIAQEILPLEESLLQIKLETNGPGKYEALLTICSNDNDESTFTFTVHAEVE